MADAGVAGSIAGKRIGLVTASASRLGGGVFEAVATHARMLEQLGARPQVFALKDGYSSEDRKRFGAVPVTTLPVLGPRQIGYAPRLARALIGAELDCLHLHGIWMYPSAAASRWAAATGRPYVISPHGMLDPWITARGRAKKALARFGYERRSWARATAFHALTEREAADIAGETGRGEIRVVPNAGPDPREGHTTKFGEPLLLYIGRIHAKKNLVALVEGWHAAPKPADARLVIAGWGDNEAVQDLRQAIARGDGSAQFVGAVYGADKQALIERARFVVLPSLSEGLPMAILEAWASGVPTIMSEACNLPVGFAMGAALECGTARNDLAAIIESAFATGETVWQGMSAAALACSRRHFSSEVIAATWASIYGEVCRGAARGASRHEPA